jgi:hypothetical protein
MLGKEDKGLLVVLSNFNHERWVMCTASAMNQRTIVEECLKYVSLSSASSELNPTFTPFADGLTNARSLANLYWNKLSSAPS